MAGIFRKLASAFVEMEPARPAQARSADPPAQGEAMGDVQDLIAQLEGSQSPRPETGNLPAELGGVLDLPVEEVYARAGLGESQATAPRVLKMIAGLAMFPPSQQVAMVRALDAADDSWSEDDVLADARARQGALRQHLQAIEQARAGQLQQLEQATRDAQTQRQEVLADIDQQIAELTKLRDEALSESAGRLSELEHQKHEVELAADRARRHITETIGQLGGLVGFFTHEGPPQRG